MILLLKAFLKVIAIGIWWPLYEYYIKHKKMSRIIDTTPISTVKSEIVDYCASLGVLEASEDAVVTPCGEEPQTWSAEDFAVYYGRLFELTSSDFSGINFLTHPAWGGPTRPPRPYA